MNIYNFIFHYNPYKELWAAVHRNAYTDYMNGIYDPEKVFFAKSKSVLLILFNDAPSN
jgi:hypothetical protein